MDESEFIREYMAVMCCNEQSALDVFILHEALAERSQPTWLDGLDGLDHLPVQNGVAGSRASTSNIC